MDDKQHSTHRDAAIGEIENIPKKQHMDEVPAIKRAEVV